jgi:hypothetical protein
MAPIREIYSEAGVTVDYEKFQSEDLDGSSFTCRCGSPNCRSDVSRFPFFEHPFLNQQDRLFLRPGGVGGGKSKRQTHKSLARRVVTARRFSEAPNFPLLMRLNEGGAP